MTINVTDTVGANNTIVLDSNSKIPAIDSSQVTTLNAEAFTTGILPVARIDVGTSANKIVQLDGNAKLPAVSGGNLTNMVEDNELRASVRKSEELKEFSTDQISRLAKSYPGLAGKTMSNDNANKLRKIFDKIPDGFLNDLRKRHIPFLSGLALSRMVQKGIPVREDTDYLKSKLNTHQINNIKNTWKSKTASDVTPAVKAMIKKMDIPTQIAIKQANIPHLSKLIEVNEDASDMAQAKATGTQKRIADLTTNINDKEDRARNINPGDKNKLAIHKADINHMKLKLADL